MFGPEADTWVLDRFPRLGVFCDFGVASECDESYNCIAFAAGDRYRWWQPTPQGTWSEGMYWPPGVPHQMSVAAYERAFATIGYVKCQDGSFETGFEKVALYAIEGQPKHAARQETDSYVWLSKLGNGYDIWHETAEGVGGSRYGEIVSYMRREVAQKADLDGPLQNQ